MAKPGETVKPGRSAIGLAVLGIVYGDIGTSPIYALRACFRGVSPVPINEANILGILSLIFWALIIVISLKYMVFILRANNHGEGGIFALLALLRPDQDQNSRSRRTLILIGLFGAGLLYGGTMLTPAISVLSAVEGLEVAAASLHNYVLPITITILILLFAVQKYGTARVGVMFGPIMVVWFLALAALGVNSIIGHPEVLRAVAPWHAAQFLASNNLTGFLVLIGVFLVVTGGEALYADLGHFGITPIRMVWFCFVLPALLLNYFGQGALLLDRPDGPLQPFFHLAPDWALLPLVGLATAATIIASQAVITGAFSLTRQAVQLGFMPRLRVQQTSEYSHGQIYMPGINWFLMIAAVALVLTFGSSDNLAAAYGISVNATMLVTTILAFNVARERGGWSLAKAGIFLLVFLTVDLSFLTANAETIPRGGWFPVAMGAIIFTVIVTWRRGTELLLKSYEANTITIETLLGNLEHDPPQRAPGTGIFFTARAEEVPNALIQLKKHNILLPEAVVIVTVKMTRDPRVSNDKRIHVKAFGQGLYAVQLNYGFMQGFNIPSDLSYCIEHHELPIDLDDATYFVGRISVIADRKKDGMMAWRDKLFAFMVRNTLHATSLYRIPSARVIEIGLQLGI
ncbi:putative potassium transport system protein kup 1 [Streptosporangium jomthongense]|uniref:Probable potassium transport system protein Kup n=1 Tax=Marinobacter aromaticivorans TaxID=1494078 RepID=A0ABW2IRG4_9GAMM|nr:potassium transporter Kup [Marinobacter aromaticivorans]GGE55202.1 putative potassium transport system protein kup 1 [Streptosporangium jomthongense]